MCVIEKVRERKRKTETKSSTTLDWLNANFIRGVKRPEIRADGTREKEGKDSLAAAWLGWCVCPIRLNMQIGTGGVKSARGWAEVRRSHMQSGLIECGKQNKMLSLCFCLCCAS